MKERIGNVFRSFAASLCSAALMALGVDEDTAAEDACKIEHVISDKTLDAITKHMKQYGKGTV